MPKKIKFIIGTDEAGRGPLAGPVFAAAVANLRKSDLLTLGVKDSKKLTARQREKIFKSLTENQRIFWAAASVSEKIIDKINIQNGSELAMKRAIFKLLKIAKRNGIAKSKRSGYSQILENFGINNLTGRCLILVDGNREIKNLKLTQKTIVKGDEKIPVISAASIIAKVLRDRFMRRVHEKYPRYNFAKHKGYGTKEHYGALKKFGPSPVHRRSFRLTPPEVN